MLTLQDLKYIERNDRTGGSIWNYATQTMKPRIGTKPDRVIQLNSEEVQTHASCKTTRTWESFNNQKPKMSLFSDELWLIANNSKVLRRGASH